MCARYYFDAEDEDLSEIMAALNRRYEAVSPEVLTSGEKTPGMLIPAVCRNRRGTPDAFLMHWGYHVGNKLVINARSESIETKPLFSDGALHRRCAVPAAAYFEWQKTGSGKLRYRFEASGRHFFWMAAIYRIMEGAPPELVILTKDAEPEYAGIHDRMPVLLSPERKENWIQETGEIQKILNTGHTPLSFGPDEPYQLSLL